MKTDRVYKLIFGKVYPMYVQKAERKGRTQEEVNIIIEWLTGYDKKSLQKIIEDEVNFQDFFEKAPQIHPNAQLIKGTICGYKVEEIKDPLMQKIRYLDKMIDELAKGKSMDKILRK